MSPAQRRQMVDREHPNLPIVRQCALLGVSRSSLYYRPRAASAEDLSLMGEIDRQYLETPFSGSRRMRAWLERQGMPVSRKRAGSTIFPSSSARKMTRPLTRLTSGCTWHANHRSARMANFVEAIGGEGL